MPVESYLTQEVLERLNLPTGRATGLPPALYTSNEFFDYERQYIFGRNWVFVATVDELAEPGTAVPVSVAGRPVVVVSDRAGTIRAFHNVCSHRGTLLVNKPSHRQAWLRCPYHSWGYGLDGTLKATPDVGGPGIHTHADLDPSKHGLTPVRCEIWQRLVFVNLSAEAPPFGDVIAPLAARWPIDPDRLRLGGVRSFELKANWKLVMENFLESYHLPSVHPSLNGYSRIEDHYNILVGANAYGQATKSFAPSTAVEGKSPLEIPDYPQHLRGHGEYPVVFPSLMLGTQATEFFAVTCEPVGPELTRERFYMFFAEAAMTDEFAKVREAVLERWFEVNVEDIDVVERMQQGRHSEARNGNLFAPDLEACVHQFAKQVAAAIIEGQRASASNPGRPKASVAARIR